MPLLVAIIVATGIASASSFSSEARCVKHAAFDSRKSKGKTGIAAAFTVSYSCVNAKDLLVCGDHSKDIEKELTACYPGVIERVLQLPPAECARLANTTQSQTVLRSIHDHHNGWYDELVMYSIPMFGTMYESWKVGPELWPSWIGSNPPGGIHNRNLDDGDLVASLLAPKMKTTVLDIRQEKGVNIENGTGDFRQAEIELFGESSRFSWGQEGILGAQCGRTTIIANYANLVPTTFPQVWGDPFRNVVFHPWYLETARKFRAAVLAARGVNPRATAIRQIQTKERPSSGNASSSFSSFSFSSSSSSSSSAPHAFTPLLPSRVDSRRALRVLVLDRHAARNSGTQSRNVNNVDEAVRYIEDNSGGRFNVTTVDWGVGSGLSQQVRETHAQDIILGSEGAGFANQLWLPLNSGVLLLHGKRPGEVAQWHTPLSQYFGHTVVNLKLAKSSRVNPASLYTALVALADRMGDTNSRGPGAAFSQCVTDDSRSGGRCVWRGDTCGSKKQPLVCP
eukprot:CAMPEP_0171801386 /NCGR_PEP_ID=MMETSP0991-20121206/72225_1 /TAXON_ID=483369 /ORGANISM="non described non described, Strain CCMP2098" /LENGTH=508 /DNA_ID=CAMNT_0012413039 /DNA_START=137 /DNA_END=1663 /DNA_ORIENTATION=+